MKNLLIIGSTTDEYDMLEKEMKARSITDIKINSTASFGQDINWWVQNKVDLVILNLPADIELQNFFLIKLKSGDVPKDIPFVILAYFLDSKILDLSSHFLALRILKSPVDGGTLFTTVNDLLTYREPDKTQGHPRFLTNEKVTVNFVSTLTDVEMTMKNLSKTGAYFETAKKLPQINGGDGITVTFHSSGTDKLHVLEAQIVWFKKISDSSSVTGMGVSFVSKNDLYNDLLKSFT